MQVNNYYQYGTQKIDNQKSTAKSSDTDKAAADKTQKTDSFEKSDASVKASEASTVYENPQTYKMDIDKVDAMKADLAKNISAFKQMVQALFQKQGNTSNVADGNPLEGLLEIDEQTQLDAQEAISENGYWGVNQTADRILEFAKALSGGDPSLIEELKNGVLAGFEAAERAWGGSLPDICYQTREKIMEGFDEWANGETESVAQKDDE